MRTPDLNNNGKPRGEALHPLSASPRRWMEEHRIQVQMLFEQNQLQKRQIIGCVDPRTAHANTIGIPGLGILQAMESKERFQKNFSWIPKAVSAGQDIVFQTHDDCAAMRRFAEQTGRDADTENHAWGTCLSELYGVRHEHLSGAHMREYDQSYAPIVYLDATRHFSLQQPFPTGFRLSVPMQLSRWESYWLSGSNMSDMFSNSLAVVLGLIRKSERNSTVYDPTVTLAVVRDAARESLSNAVHEYAKDYAGHRRSHFKVIAFDQQGNVED